MLSIQRAILLASVLIAAEIASATGELPASLIRVPESTRTLFIAETSAAMFHRFDRSNDELAHSGSYYMSIGQAGTGKSRSGDKRTPLGVYFVTEQLDTSRLHEKYGITAFPLDYPNVWDRRVDRYGDGIWVHGVQSQNGQRPERDTDGCIALSNSDLAMLAPEFEDNVTPVLITQVVVWKDTQQVSALRTELESRVAEWVDSRATGDLHTYLSLYDDKFRRWGMDKAEWSSFRMQTQSNPRKANLSDLLLLGYPDEEGLYLSRFRLMVLDGDRETTSTKRLYWHRNTRGVLKIIAEDEG